MSADEWPSLRGPCRADPVARPSSRGPCRAALVARYQTPAEEAEASSQALQTVSGASFDTPIIRSLLSNATIVMDNEPRNKDIVRQLAKYIDLGYNVCIFPDYVQEKDINDMILSGKTQDEILELINTNTHQGIEAKLKFSSWKKV
jgi:hypothetical protein